MKRKESTQSTRPAKAGRVLRAGLGVPLAAVMTALLVLPGSAVAVPPAHLATPSLNIEGLNHACGVAVDSGGDIYAASAGESKIRIFNPAHSALAQIENSNQPCGLAVNSKGELFVSERGTGNVVRYKPNAYPLSGSPTYGAAEPIDSSGKARGIALDWKGLLYVAEDDHLAVYKADGSFQENILAGQVEDASGVAVATSAHTGGSAVGEYGAIRRIYVAGEDEVRIFAGTASSFAGFGTLSLERTIDGVDHDGDPETAKQQFNFGELAYLSVDPGNAESTATESKCVPIAEQACTFGHLLVYDPAHDAVDELDGSGEFIDQFTSPSLDDGEPTAMAVDRSGGPGDGTIYVTAGAGPAAKVLAFGPLVAPSRAPLPAEPPSRTLEDAGSLEVDQQGYLYVAAGPKIHVYTPGGSELAIGAEGQGIEDSLQPFDIDIDSVGNVYVVDRQSPSSSDNYSVSYFKPSEYPPTNATTYKRSAPVVEEGSFPVEPTQAPEAIAINPADDHLYINGGLTLIEINSAAGGSTLIRSFPKVLIENFHNSIDVYGANGNVYLGANNGGGGRGGVQIINGAGTKIVARIFGNGSPTGKFPRSNPQVAVDQSNGHVLAFDYGAGQQGAAAGQEYDAAGGFVAQFEFPPPQDFTTETFRANDIAIDNSAGSTRGRVYVAFDDPKPNTPDVWAFNRLEYGETPAPITGVASDLDTDGVTLNGTVNPSGFLTTECNFRYLPDSDYQTNLSESDPPFEGATSVPCAQNSAEIGKGTAPIPVDASVATLPDPEGRYRFQLVVANKYGETEGEARLFGPPVIETRPALPVLYTEATFRAKVDPTGLATKYRFQFGTASGSYDQETPALELTAFDDPAEVFSDVTGLLEGVTYHYRVVAENESGTATGPDQEFTTLQRPAGQNCTNQTYRTGLSANLPDCRAYELVTPAETNGLTPMSREELAAGNTLFDYWNVMPRGDRAGERVSYFAFGTLPGFEGNGISDGYRAERGIGDHPVEGWSTELTGPSYQQAVPNVTLIPPGHQGVSPDQMYSFWRIEPFQTFEETLPTGMYLRTPEKFEVAAQGPLGSDLEAVTNYLAADGAHIIFSSEVRLHASAPPTGTTAVYDRPAGKKTARVVSVKPGGGAFGVGENANFIATSDDGSKVAFRVSPLTYVRVGTKTVALSEKSATIVSLDGARAYYIEAGDDALMACQTTGASCAGEGATQTPLTIAKEVEVAKASADGQTVLFVSKEALTEPGDVNGIGEHAEAGELNLYWWSSGYKFIARVQEKDLAGGRFLRITPDGSVAAFESRAKLTAYDNDGATEIYRFDATQSVEQALLCVSCDPSFAPPVGGARFVDTEFGGAVSQHVRVANLTDDGEAVFFQSDDRLLPEDANDAMDVYEWRAEGSGSCSRLGGCLGLISSGQGEGDSFLYGLSADGRDVLFRTRERLVSSDVSGSPSLYDARIDGGIPQIVAPAPCQGDACQGAGDEAPAFSPPTTTGNGNGNISSPTKKHCPRGKRLVRRNGKERCIKRNHHRKAKQRRAGQDRRTSK
jgi:hypothetical protein